ncbi:uncharacterized protein FPRO_07590 [Fusarium proliferatum ET1]|uniref:Uncharacterized protein n=1 Tax=Fusarium proliferatum (strain ET1) TaxID=1227346 RepID=A0A1L7VSU6_FUSPR|nr:uncharacterized protein FPRO_07590 [Fusarium proliferatum ET1]CZR43493.1 uncharacterized protein FPRO_07590 [Fusarium proliferatum ET1]
MLVMFWLEVLVSGAARTLIVLGDRDMIKCEVMVMLLWKVPAIPIL